MINVAINGYGRIGRNVLRALYERPELHAKMQVVAINDLGSAQMNAHLTQFDTTHGRFNQSVSIDQDDLVIGSDHIRMLSERDPTQLPWEQLSVDIVFECTGLFTHREAARQHVSAGAKRILVSAPGQHMDATVVYGINHTTLTEVDVIVSNASCTTNCLAPIAKPLNDSVGIEQGLMTTIHAYTNDQNLVDNMHSKYRRGRAAALNMVITETGAGKAVTKAIPSLEGKLTSSAIRVPTPNGSLAILNLTVEKETNLEDINNLLHDAAFDSELVEQIRFSVNNELVSSDIVGDSCPSIYDSPATQVSNDGKSIVLYIWYDNEYGYTRQVLRLAKHIAKVRRNCYY